MNPVIKKITGDDLDALSRLYAELSGGPSDTALMEVELGRINSNSDYYLFGAFIDGELAGSVMGIVCRDLCGDCRPFMTMENMVVAEKFQGRGVGLKLVEQIELTAVERKCVFNQFCSSSFRTGAHRFYASAGYDPGMVKGFRKFL